MGGVCGGGRRRMDFEIRTSAARSIRPRARFQFGLGTMFLITAMVAVSCSLFFQMPNVVATPLLVLFMLVLPAVLTTVLVYGRGYQRAFCLGALFPAGTMLVCTSFMLVVHSISAYEHTIAAWADFAEKVGPYYRPYAGIAWVSCFVVGFLNVVVCWLVERGARKRDLREARYGTETDGEVQVAGVSDAQ